MNDCAKFVAREIRRRVRYDGIIMDLPSDRGPGGEVWEIWRTASTISLTCARAF
ncbi:MAG: hypothetical protein ACLRZH_15960 [Ruthenibacterium lactatiformans]